MGVCITGSGRLHKSAIFYILGSTRPAGMPGSHKVRLEDIALSGVGKITHLCNPPEPVMRAPIYVSRTVPEWDCT